MAYDDRSDDNSVETLERFGSTAPFTVRIIRGSSHVGSTRAFERALDACTGDLIALCDQDDLWRRDKLERAVSAFERAPERGLVFSDATVINRTGRTLGRSVWKMLRTQQPAAGRDLGFFLESLVRPTVPGCTALFSARCVEQALPFPPTLGSTRRAMQHDAWLVAITSATSDVAALPETLVAYRIHGDQQIGLRGAAARKRLGTTARRAIVLNTKRSLLKSELEARASGVELVSGHLARIAGDPWTRACSDAAIDVAEHLRQRIALPPDRRQRVRPVLEEWRTRRYGRYSSGVLSAIADAISR